jgi:hypothetical protein
VVPISLAEDQRVTHASFLVILVVSLLLLAPVAPALASIVDVTFSGALTSGPLAGSSYTGTFTYDTTAAIVFTGATSRDFALATGALSVTLGADTVSNTNGGIPDLVEVVDFGRLEIKGNTVAGTGPLNGFNAFVTFEFSSDPAFAALILPFPFPTDFTSGTLAVNSAGGFSSGPLREFSAVNTPTGVPAPATGGLLGWGAAGLALHRLRVGRARQK